MVEDLRKVYRFETLTHDVARMKLPGHAGARRLPERGAPFGRIQQFDDGLGKVTNVARIDEFAGHVVLDDLGHSPHTVRHHRHAH